MTPRSPSKPSCRSHGQTVVRSTLFKGEEEGVWGGNDTQLLPRRAAVTSIRQDGAGRRRNAVLCRRRDRRGLVFFFSPADCTAKGSGRDWMLARSGGVGREPGKNASAIVDTMTPFTFTCTARPNRRDGQAGRSAACACATATSSEVRPRAGYTPVGDQRSERGRRATRSCAGSRRGFALGRAFVGAQKLPDPATREAAYLALSAASSLGWRRSHHVSGPEESPRFRTTYWSTGVRGLSTIPRRPRRRRNRALCALEQGGSGYGLSIATVGRGRRCSSLWFED